MDYQTLQKEIQQGKISPVYLFIGEEDYLANLLVDQILDSAIDQSTKDFNLDIFYASDIEVGDVINIVTAYPMMAERRVVVMKELHKLTTGPLQTLASYVDNPLSTTCLILLGENLNFKIKAAKKIRDKSVYVKLKPLYENQVPDWVKRQLREKNLDITDAAIRLLQASTGTSMRAIMSEIEKIQLNIHPRQLIEEENVAEAVGITRQFSVFELCDAVGRKDINRSLKVLSHMMSAGESAPGLISMLARHFRLLLKTKELLKRRQPERAISKAIGVNPFFLKGYLQQSKNYSNEAIRKIFELLLEADITLKSRPQSPHLVLELVLQQIIRGTHI